MAKTRIKGLQIRTEDFIKSEESGEVDWNNDTDTASMKAIAGLVSAAADKHFTFEWRALQTSVTIQHNLHKRPSVTVVDTGGTELFCDVAYNDDDNVTLTFSTAVRGTAYLN
ncbi:MAG: hypothetical protein IKQ52_05725 [Bacteroidales bacterium]|nr:hypothetical protein [Bacteroidales bacterium]